MKIDCNDYKLALQHTDELFLDMEGQPDIRRIGVVALSSDVPIVAVAYYYRRLYGSSPKLDAFIIKLCQFYKISEILEPSW